jgi:type IV secretory pathway TraG/TraD family ATPase VirD4
MPGVGRLIGPHPGGQDHEAAHQETVRKSDGLVHVPVAIALEAMERTGPLEQGKPAVLFCLDEFAALGHMESIEKAAGQIAGFGVKLWPVIQDLTQLQRDYKLAWETFMGNAGLLPFIGAPGLNRAFSAQS